MPTLMQHRYVGNIHSQVTEPLLQEVFSGTGPLEGCKLIRKEKVCISFLLPHLSLLVYRLTILLQCSLLSESLLSPLALILPFKVKINFQYLYFLWRFNFVNCIMKF